MFKVIAFALAVAQSEASDPTSLAQRQSDDVTNIPLGGVATSTTVMLRAVVNGTNATAGYKLRVEVRATSAAQTGVFTHEGSVWVGQGGTSVVTVSGLTPGQTYYWRGRSWLN